MVGGGREVTACEEKVNCCKRKYFSASLMEKSQRWLLEGLVGGRILREDIIKKGATVINKDAGKNKGF